MGFKTTLFLDVPFRRLFGAAFLILAISGVVSRPASGQVVYGSVVGTVTDPTGSVIPGAALTLTSRETSLSTEATSDSSGRYSFVNVMPGRYNLKVVAKGFRALAENDFEVV